ncbi:hypothetical protein [Oceanobacillus alkalisoli]|uniref:hypothetical protein n=1 Tax=Oceanobacillus alkalisoli TaxID=2925113 RepID=UPI001EE4DB2C|nr:hypothetical protein [Oceanobacillus alkalisoli]MCG5105365.1 hypothetical protein [Oceanobacillus alkalisoli]
MKRYLPLLVVGVLVILFLFVKNENYRNELKHVKNEISELESAEEVIYLEAGEIGEQFILGYFNYRGKPVKGNVEMYVSEEKIKELNFDTNEEYDEKLVKVKSTVNNLDIYLGKSTDGRQKVLGIFINEIEMGDVVTLVDSFIELDLEKTDDLWRIVDFNFFQY